MLEFRLVLKDILERQFYGFLNLALRNPWLFIKESKPRNLSKRKSQINSSLRRLGLETESYLDFEEDITEESVDIYCDYNGKLKFNTERVKVLSEVLETLAHILTPESLKKLAEKRDRNVKLMILELLSRYQYDKMGFKSHWRTLSYRKQRSRAVKTLAKLELISKTNKEYHLTDVGREIATKIYRARYKWVNAQSVQLLHYFRFAQPLSSK